MDRGLALTITLAVGALVAFQPPANALLARHVGDLGAAFVSLVLATVIVGVLLLASGDVAQLGGITGFRPVHVLGGIAGAAVVVVSLITVRSLGAGGVAAALVVTQLIFAAIADWLGWFDLEGTPLSAERLIGIALLIAGTVLVTSR
jgi:transporter family-2 protein